MTTTSRLAFLLVLSTGCALTTARGRTEGPTADPLADSSVITGKLPNGFSYYVVSNAQPSNGLSLRLLVKAGAVQEDDDQRSAAHFVEHLAFDGTQNFNRRDIGAFMDGWGMSGGSDVSAETRLDSTEYRLVVPSDFPRAMGMALVFLRDVAGTIAFDPAEIERERRVLVAEWRTRLSARQRVARAQSGVLFAGSRYADRLLLNSPAEIKSATRETLLRFYREWYRPDAMALVAVGPIDPKALVKAIELAFGDLKGPEKERPATLPDVPDHHELVAKIITDPELTSTSLALYSRLERSVLTGKAQVRETLVQVLAAGMMRARLQYGRASGSAFLGVQTSRPALARGVPLMRYTADVSDGGLKQSVQALFAERASASRYGFTQQELTDARQLTAGASNQLWRTDAELSSEKIADALEELFLFRIPYHDRIQVRAWVRELLPAITLADVNAWAREHSGARGTLFISAPSGVVVPTDAELRVWTREASLNPPAAPVEQRATGPLLSANPKPGTVTDTEQDTYLGLTIWQLSNGARVIVKPLPSYAGAVTMQGWVSGGTAQYSDSDFAQARFATDIARDSGAGTHDARELSQVLGVIGSSVDLSFSDSWGSLRVDTNASDLEKALQVAYLRLTEPRLSREGFASWKVRALQDVRHRDRSPDTQFWRAAGQATNDGDPRALRLSASDIEQVDRDQAYSIWRERLSAFGRATFFVVGDVQLDRLKPLVETYLASLPSGPAVAIPKAPLPQYPNNPVERTVVAGRAPRSKVLLQFAAPDQVDGNLLIDLEIFEDVLAARLKEALRGRLGDVYDMGVSAWCAREPTVHHALRIVFECAPDKVEPLTKAVFAALNALSSSGITNDEVEALKLRVFRRWDGQYNDVDWWFDTLKRMYVYGDSSLEINETTDALARVTSVNVTATARRLFDEKRYVRVVLRPDAVEARPRK